MDKIGQPVSLGRLFTSAFENYLRGNGWKVHHHDKHGERFWHHPHSSTTFHTSDAVTRTPAFQAARGLPVRHSLVTNRPALSFA